MDRRFRLRHEAQRPLAILQVGGELIDRRETTLNISWGGGVAFRSAEPLRIGDPVEYRIILPDGDPPTTVFCFGYIRRCDVAASEVAASDNDASRDGEAFDIAMTMEQYRFARR